MPSNKRQAIKEKVDQIILKVEKSQNESINLANLYMELHPDYGNSFMLIASHLEKVAEMTKAIRDAI